MGRESEGCERSEKVGCVGEGRERGKGERVMGVREGREWVVREE